MGTKERKERQKKELRRTILDAATDILSEKGLESLTIRAIAERIEYSPSTIYEYFPDKEAIFDELRSGLLRELIAGMREVPCDKKHPENDILNLAKFMWNFFAENMKRYEVSLQLRKAAFPPKEIGEMREMMKGALQKLGYAALQNEHAMQDAINLVRVFLEGLAFLTITQRLLGGMDMAHHLFEAGIKTLLKGWKEQ